MNGNQTWWTRAGVLFLNAFRIRIALMAIGAIATIFYLLAGGRLGHGNRGTLQIEFGLYPEKFEGMQLTVDGKPAGVLESHGAATRSAFSIVEGRHEIALVSSEFGCLPRIVDIESGRTMMLVVDVGSASYLGARPQIQFQ